jgi:exosortase/archaeosortase
LELRHTRPAMQKRPRSITVISWLCIVFGSVALVIGLLPNVNATAAQRLVELKTHWYVHVIRMLEVLAGIFMLYGFNWARWLLVIWSVGHVIIGALHSPLQLVIHTLLFAVVIYFLFRPPASAYFRASRAIN